MDGRKMQLRAEEISRIIKQQIEQYDQKVEVTETGTILTVGDGIARVYGLDKAMAGEPRYQRNPAVSETEIDGEIFLVEPETEEVFYLDAMGSGLWRLLAEPQTMREAAAVYAAAFPETDRGTIEDDLGAALNALLDRGLVVLMP